MSKELNIYIGDQLVGQTADYTKRKMSAKTEFIKGKIQDIADEVAKLYIGFASSEHNELTKLWRAELVRAELEEWEAEHTAASAYEKELRAFQLGCQLRQSDDLKVGESLSDLFDRLKKGWPL